MSRSTKWFSAVMVTALLAAALLGGAVSAQEPEATPSQPPGRGRGIAGRLWSRGSWEGYDAAAEALVLTPDELFSKLHSGMTLEEIADEQGVDLEAIKDAVNAVQQQTLEDRIEQAVTDGKLTREQADWLLKGIELDMVGPGGKMGHWVGGRGCRPRPGSSEGESTPSVATSAGSFASL